jgi:hypothetical protein
MALNIPVNLMSTVATQSQALNPSTDAVDASATIQPTNSSANARDAASGGQTGGGNDLSAPTKGSATERASDGVNKKEAKQPDETTAHALVQKTMDANLERTAAKAEVYGSELDRYAPPNPLPTAPILQAAATYATASKGT